MSIVIEGIGNLISSVFLTYLVSRSTLTTKLQVIFVFLYFVFMNSIFWVIYKKKMKKVLLKKRVLLGIFAAFLALAGAYLSLGSIYPNQYDTPISLVTYGEKNPEAFGREIWISNITVDDQSLLLSDIALTEGWVYKADNNSIYINPEENMKYLLELSLPEGQKVSITFEKHNWSGIINVDNEDFVLTEDLYSQEPTQVVCEIQRQCAAPGVETQILLYLACPLTLYRVFSLILGWLNCHYSQSQPTISEE